MRARQLGGLTPSASALALGSASASALALALGRRAVGGRALATVATMATALLGLVGAGCPEDRAASDTDATDGETLPGDRTYLLGAWTEGYDHRATTVPTPWIAATSTFTAAVAGGAGGAATRGPLAEVLVIPLDQLGIPWSAFSGPENAPGQLPAAWGDAVGRLEVLAAATDLPIVLALSPLAPTYDTLAPEARDEAGRLVLDSGANPRCYDPSKDGNQTKLRDQFAGYAVWAVGRFHPRWVVVGQRLNLYEASCGASAFTALAGYANEAARRIAALEAPPETIASVDVEDLYGLPMKAGRCQAGTRAECLATRKGLLDALSTNYIGLESYPGATLEGTAVPAQWIQGVAALRPTVPKAIVGIAVPALTMQSDRGVCQPLIASTDAIQTAFLDQAIAAADAHDMPFLVWRSVVDAGPEAIVASCPCAGDAVWCQHLDGLGPGADLRRIQLLSGLIAQDGTERDGAAIWRSLLGKPAPTGVP